MKIFLWQADSSGCGYFRCQLPAHALADIGHQVAYNEIMPGWVKEPGAVDVLVAQRTCNPGPSDTWQQLARRADRPKLVFELDDDFWHLDPANKQAADFFTPERLRRLEDNIRVADVVTVSTEPLADVVSEFNGNVHVVPNQIPAWLLEHERPRMDRTVLGWRGGASHARDFGEMAQPLRRFLQHPAYRDRVEFHCLGQDHTARVATPHGRTRHTDWIPGCADFLRAVDFDCALVPLRPSVFNESKSELALLEMAALGIPAVVSATGPYARISGQVPSIRLTHSAKDWTEHLADFMAEEPEHREVQSKVLREWAATRTVEGNVSNWERAYEA